MTVLQALCYLLAILLLVLAAFGVNSRVSLALMGAAFALLAFSIPTIHAAFS